MIFIRRYILIVLAMSTLSSCSVFYRHPDYEFNSAHEQARFDLDRKACESAAEREHCIEQPDKASMIYERDGQGGHRCRTVVPKKCTVDTIDACLRGKGWRKADMHGNYLE